MPFLGILYLWQIYAIANIPLNEAFVSVTTKREVFCGVGSQELAPYFLFMGTEKTCSFFGHRKITVTDAFRKVVRGEIENALQAGCRIFLFGGFGAFDEFCYQTVTESQKQAPHLNIRRIFCVPQERYLRKKAHYFNEEDYEKIVYLTPAFEGWYKSIYYRNLAMIDHSDYVIFYTEKRENSGAYKAYRYAKKQKEKRIVNLFDTMASPV